MIERISPNIVIQRCKQAGIDFWTASQAAIDLKDSLIQGMDDAKINRAIARKLGEISEDAAQQFNSYHSIQVRTSKNRLEPFDREAISRSLTKEARIPKVTADEIAEEVEMNIRRLQLKDVSAPLIREMANAKLIEKRMVNAKQAYARIGLPVYDITDIVENQRLVNPSIMNNLFGDAVLQEYTLTKVLDRRLSEAHLNNDIHIYNLERFITVPTSFMNDFRLFLRYGLSIPRLVTTGPAKQALVAVSHAARVLSLSNAYTSSGSAIDSFNVLLAPFLAKERKKDVKQIAQSFLYELNEHYAGPHAFTVNLDYDMPAELAKQEAVGPGGETAGRYGDYKDEARDFLETLLATAKEGDRSGKQFDWPEFCIKHDGIKDITYPKGTYFVRQRKNEALVGGSVISEGGGAGVMQAVSINVQKICSQASDEKELYDALEQQLATARDIMIAKNEVINKRLYRNKTLEFLTQSFEGKEYVKPKEFSYIVSLPNVEPASAVFLEKPAYDEQCMRVCERILRYASRKLREFKRDTNLNFVLGEMPAKRFDENTEPVGIRTDLLLPTGRSVTETHSLLQSICPAGKFLETSDPSLINNKEILFLKLV